MKQVSENLEKNHVDEKVTGLVLSAMMSPIKFRDSEKEACTTHHLFNADTGGFVPSAATEIKHAEASSVKEVKLIDATMAGPAMSGKTWPTKANGNHIYLKEGTDDTYLVKVSDQTNSALQVDKMVEVKLSVSEDGKVYAAAIGAGYQTGRHADSAEAVNKMWRERVNMKVA